LENCKDSMTVAGMPKFFKTSKGGEKNVMIGANNGEGKLDLGGAERGGKNKKHNCKNNIQTTQSIKMHIHYDCDRSRYERGWWGKKMVGQINGGGGEAFPGVKKTSQ